MLGGPQATPQVSLVDRDGILALHLALVYCNLYVHCVFVVQVLRQHLEQSLAHSESLFRHDRVRRFLCCVRRVASEYKM